MGVRSHPRRDRQIEKISGILKKQDEAYLDPSILFGMVSADDVLAFRPEALAAAAIDAWRNLQAWDGAQARVVVDHINDVEMGGAALTVVTIIDRNMPFLYDSVMGEISASHRDLQLAAHPIVSIGRSKDGAIEQTRLFSAGDQGALEKVSVIQIHLHPLSDAAREELADALASVLDQVHRANSDWRAMLTRLDSVITSLETSKTSHDPEVKTETLAFLEWLRDDNFTFLGMREYVYSGYGMDATIERAAEEGIGILSDPDVRVLRRGADHVSTTPELLAFMQGSDMLIVTKANVRSLVHRRAYMDYVGVKRYDEKGQVIGELRIVGLFTSSAYTRSVTRIPLLRSKVHEVISSFGFDPEGHSGKALLNVLESYPRDELFQIDVPMLAGFCEQVLELNDRPRVRVLPRIDRFDRFVSVILYVPRDQYDSEARVRVAAYLKDVFDAHLSAFYPAFPEGSVARVHFIFGRSSGKTPRVPQEVLEENVRRIVTRWEDRFLALAGPDGLALHTSDAYRDYFTPEEAVEDLQSFLDCLPDNDIGLDFYQRAGETSDHLGLKIFHLDEAVELSRRVPMLENLGFNVISEQTFELSVGEDVGAVRTVVLHNMELVQREGQAIDLPRIARKLEDAFLAVWSGKVDNDGFNRLVVNCGMSVREVKVMRTYARYLRQIGVTYSQGYISEALNRYHDIACDILELFERRFALTTPEDEMHKITEEIRLRIDEALVRVPSQDDDRILRQYVNLISATLRTNYYQGGDNASPAILSLKLDPRAIDGMPAPAPFREIFVYGAEVEGVHLRFGPIARGGLRWSDRAQDYRTEVLGLVKAQQVKNAVIVPVGSKGGFYPKELPTGGSRDDVFKAGREAYKTFISSLLDITDNIIDGVVTHPEETRCIDGDDPYFVVAADKGTATFSDTANAISQAHDFWLDDAFASGGSAGYDHKKMGITARGAWEAVKRHFREMNIDIQTTEFTAAGVGDMSGDVFGNGMLLSPKIRLVAAFDHRDIFIDPEPVCSTSFKERKRVFELGRSSWQDYDKSKLSKGGMIVSRSQKSIKLTDEAAAAIGLTKTTATPQEVLRAILKMDIDLMWFGGIGTYIKEDGESDAEVGDRGNDGIRVTASQVGAKVIGEGANLGVTQRGRIAYCLKGGRCNSDAIDNSAGVNSSDVEVNIKIALAKAMREGRLNRANRDKLLTAMTEQVAELVLRNNYLQTLAISIVEQDSAELTGDMSQLMNDLESAGHLDRQVETLPDDLELAERVTAGKPLTRPEIGVLLSYAKIVLFDELTESHLPDNPYFESTLVDYFPKRMHKTHRDDILEHRLRREIVSTVLANDVINRGGPSFISRMADATGMLPSQIVGAFVVVRDGLGLSELYDIIDSLDNQTPGAYQNELYGDLRHIFRIVVRWSAKAGVAQGPLADMVEALAKAVKTLQPVMPDILPNFMRRERQAIYQRAIDHGVPEKQAARLSETVGLVNIPDIMLAANLSNAGLEEAAKIYFDVTRAYRISRLEAAAYSAKAADFYEELAIGRSLDEISAARRNVMNAVITQFGKEENPVAAWQAADRLRRERIQARINELIDSGDFSISRLTVAAGMMSDLAAQ
ncbi:NAD-glutamate dehydrogenase [Hoeflea sp. WL0058]|uniref:NAD-glutamate dehydrogenase n=1 Tax=Flavimaribacter sediminis TaxID=2865987 RepID=A0AAE3D0C6_9HYPH|nr:NAD-glutamate dehydrogenase [Flavimaribacter sediminis]MBW8638375.1 NAD-glutamate dehydrogenase [Flavimaribacter sediminis]